MKSGLGHMIGEKVNTATMRKKFEVDPDTGKTIVELVAVRRLDLSPQ